MSEKRIVYAVYECQNCKAKFKIKHETDSPMPIVTFYADIAIRVHPHKCLPWRKPHWTTVGLGLLIGTASAEDSADIEDETLGARLMRATRE